ncbi:BON domain-containing protein [Sphingopyxis witflariensis]|uniref:Ornithine aminotransferase n=1 Tax=Sphingopyxis witflariensis TaxID=173675 RepID=A0A246JDR4_9SPHN|nr:BON domain-containing protein [Sphingopyxis witflariensis]OWQ90637.1 ornithine aminotransferase [Sphingopyxis witflariensis]
MLRKEDDQLQEDVIAELEWDPSVDHTDIGVAVHDGIVTLAGYVKNFPQKVAAERAVRRVAGVRALAEELKVRLVSDPKTADHEIAKRIVDMIGWTVAVPDGQIKVKVEHGWVTLTGTVDWHFISREVARAAGQISGVTGVSNSIKVGPLPTPADVEARIMAAFKRQAGLDAGGVSVTTDGSTVQLRGKVKAWGERRIAELAAWSAPGVTGVEDHLAIDN